MTSTESWLPIGEEFREQTRHTLDLVKHKLVTALISVSAKDVLAPDYSNLEMHTGNKVFAQYDV